MEDLADYAKLEHREAQRDEDYDIEVSYSKHCEEKAIGEYDEYNHHSQEFWNWLSRDIG